MDAEGGRLNTQSDVLKDAILPEFRHFPHCCEKKHPGNHVKAERFVMTDGFTSFGSGVTWSHGIG